MFWSMTKWNSLYNRGSVSYEVLCTNLQVENWTHLNNGHFLETCLLFRSLCTLFNCNHFQFKEREDIAIVHREDHVYANCFQMSPHNSTQGCQMSQNNSKQGCQKIPQYLRQDCQISPDNSKEDCQMSPENSRQDFQMCLQNSTQGCQMSPENVRQDCQTDIPENRLLPPENLSPLISGLNS